MDSAQASRHSAKNPPRRPFTGLNNPADVAVDSVGNIYLTDTGGNQVVKLSVATVAEIPCTA